MSRTVAFSSCHTIKVDGRDNWPSYNFVWAIGSKTTVSAPAEQFDAAGRKYVFKGWSNGGAAMQEVLVDASAATNGGLRLTANYELLNRTMIGSTVFLISNSCSVSVPLGGRILMN